MPGEDTTTLVKNNKVHITIAGFVSLIITVVGSAFYFGSQVATLQAEVSNLRKDLEDIKGDTEKINNLELCTSLTSIKERVSSIDRRLFTMEQSMIMKYSRRIFGEEKKPKP